MIAGVTNVGDHRPAEHRVGEAVADVAHAAQDHVGAHETGDRADQHGGQEAAAEELEGEGVSQGVHAPSGALTELAGGPRV